MDCPSIIQGLSMLKVRIGAIHGLLQYPRIEWTKCSSMDLGNQWIAPISKDWELGNPRIAQSMD